jgi:hypothetical protein
MLRSKFARAKLYNEDDSSIDADLEDDEEKLYQ